MRATWVSVMLVALVLVAACSTDASLDANRSASRPSSVPTTADTSSSPADRPGTTSPVSTTSPAPPAAPPTSTPGTDVIEPVAGSPKGDDPYFPSNGNGGYDVEHYDLAIRAETSASGTTSSIDATATITLTATDDLSSLSLDLVGLEVGAVTVDDQRADFDQRGDEVEVTPQDPIAEGATATLAVDYGGTPSPAPHSFPAELGWNTGSEATWVVSEPIGAPTWFPANDRPDDKATFRFAITVPDGLDAVANGAMISAVADGDGGRTFVWEMDEPMATYLATVVIDDLELVTDDGPDGIELRDAIPASLPNPDVTDLHAQMLTYFSEKFGPYPFGEYGIVVVDADLGFALETQTLSVFGRGTTEEGILAHELAHQWYGNSVTNARWADIWLNEGFATYAQHMWSAEGSGADGALSLDDRMKNLHTSLLDDRTNLRDPGPDSLFAGPIYTRGALVLHALRKTAGDDAFFEILRTWAERYKYANATTEDFIALAEELGGDEIGAALEPWLDGSELPPFPD